MKLRIALFCLLGGLCFTVFAMGTGHFGYWWLAGVVTVSALVPVARFGPPSLLAQWGILFLILEVIAMGCTFSEAVVFFPEVKAPTLQAVPFCSVIYVLMAAALMGLAKALKITDPVPQEIAHRPAVAVGPLVLASAASYVVYYLIFGGITFLFFTRHYYPHAVEQVAAMGNWFWGYQLARGLAMTLAVVPMIYTLRLPRWQTVLVTGILVWVVGGAGQLLVPSPLMTTAQRYIHIVEIMSQNVALGMTAAWLLRAKAGVAVAQQKLVHAA